MPTDRDDESELEEYRGEHQRESVLLWRDYSRNVGDRTYRKSEGAEVVKPGATDALEVQIASPSQVPLPQRMSEMANPELRCDSVLSLSHSVDIEDDHALKEVAPALTEPGAGPAGRPVAPESPTAMVERIQHHSTSPHRRAANLTGGPLSQPVPATADLIHALTVLLPHMGSDQFFILASNTRDDYYAQTAVTDDGFLIEFRAGNNGLHYSSMRNDISAEEVARRFSQYLECDMAWRAGLAMNVLDHKMNHCHGVAEPPLSISDFEEVD